jgi:hypothetical protein
LKDPEAGNYIENCKCEAVPLQKLEKTSIF